jgi:hypothetical protein
MLHSAELLPPFRVTSHWETGRETMRKQSIVQCLLIPKSTPLRTVSPPFQS